jgi:ABC-type amino acid transport substrate-binding protein
MTSNRKAIVIAIILAFVFNAFAFAKEYKVAIMQLPTSESFASFFKAIGDATNNTFDIQIVPPARAIYLIENKQVDIIFPATVSNDSKKQDSSSYVYSIARVFKAIFVLYSNKAEPIDVEELKKGNIPNYKIETTASLADMFEFKPLTTTNLEGSMIKVGKGTIDGFLYAQEAGDPLLTKLGVQNINRRLYSKNDIAFGIQKGSNETEINKMLNEGVDKLRTNGKLNQILAVSITNSEYNEWQP